MYKNRDDKVNDLVMLCITMAVVCFVLALLVIQEKTSDPENVPNEEQTGSVGSDDCPIVARYEAANIATDYDYYLFLLDTEEKFDCTFGDDMWEARVQ